MFNLEDYETVEVRLEKFIKDFPDFRVETELVSFQNDRYIVKAWIYRTFADSTPFSSGLAEETIAVEALMQLAHWKTARLARSAERLRMLVMQARVSDQAKRKWLRSQEQNSQSQSKTISLS